MKLLEGKTGVIMGIANNRSIASFIAQHLHAQGADLIFSHLPDEKGKMAGRVRNVISELGDSMLLPCDVNDDEQVKMFFDNIAGKYEKIDFLIHSIAFAPLDDIRCPTLHCSRSGFLQAMESSVYSLICTSKYASKLMTNGGSIVTMSYFGGEKVIPGYNLMGVAKSALESSVRYLAYDLGKSSIRINAISAGPIKTLASSAIGDFNKMLEINSKNSPLDRNIKGEEVAKSTAYLVSDLSTGTTGEIHHVDGGYHIMGAHIRQNQ